VAARSPRTGS